MASVNGKRRAQVEHDETVGGTHMTAEEFLGQAYRLDQRINSKLAQLDALRSLTQRVTASYGSEYVSHTRNVTGLQDSIIHLVEAEEELNQQIDHLVDTKMQISKVIDQVRNESYRLILEMRYLCFQSWDVIAESMHYSRRWVLNKHERALAVVESILKEMSV